MFNIGPMELILILIVALVVVGPKRLPEVGRTIGKSLREFRKAQDDVRRSLDLGLNDDEDDFTPSSPPPKWVPPSDDDDMETLPDFPPNGAVGDMEDDRPEPGPGPHPEDPDPAGPVTPTEAE